MGDHRLTQAASHMPHSVLQWPPLQLSAAVLPRKLPHMSVPQPHPGYLIAVQALHSYNPSVLTGPHPVRFYRGDTNSRMSHLTFIIPPVAYPLLSYGLYHNDALLHGYTLTHHTYSFSP